MTTLRRQLEASQKEVSSLKFELKSSVKKLNMVNLARAQSDFTKIFQDGEAEELVKQYEQQ